MSELVLPGWWRGLAEAVVHTQAECLPEANPRLESGILSICQILYYSQAALRRPDQRAMACDLRGLANQVKFISEIDGHFPG